MILPICHQNRLKSSSNTWHTLFSWLVSYPLFMILCLAALSCKRKVIKKIGATQNCQNILRSSASLHISISHRFTCSCAFDSRNLRLSMYHSFSQLSSSCPATTSHAWFSIRISCASSTVSRMYGLLDRTAGSIHWSDCNKLCAFTSSERLYRRTCDADHTSRLPRSRRGWQKTLVRVDHMATKTSATWYSVYFGQVHACTLVILHACTIAQVHACTLAKVHARAMAKVHACALAIVHLRQMFQWSANAIGEMAPFTVNLGFPRRAQLSQCFAWHGSHCNNQSHVKTFRMNKEFGTGIVVLHGVYVMFCTSVNMWDCVLHYHSRNTTHL